MQDFAFKTKLTCLSQYIAVYHPGFSNFYQNSVIAAINVMPIKILIQGKDESIATGKYCTNQGNSA